MKNYLKLFILFNLLCAIFYCKAQKFEEFNPDWEIKGEIVDPYLASHKNLGELPIGDENWIIRYAQNLNDLVPVSYKKAYETIKDKKTGKEISFIVYKEPVFYYAILDLPNEEGRFYGIITTGYNSINTVRDKPKQEWHPYTEVIPLKGSIIKPDGSVENFIINREKELKEQMVSKSIGSYWANDKLGFEEVNMVFNSNGTGLLTGYKGSYSWTLLYMLAPESGLGAKKTPSGNFRGGARKFTGGYEIWMRPVLKRNFKWNMNEDGEIIITPYGTTTVTIEDGIIKNERQIFSSEFDRKFAENEDKQDFKTNKEAVLHRKFFKEMIKCNFEKIDKIIMNPLMLSKNEMVTTISIKINDNEGFDVEPFYKEDQSFYDIFMYWWEEDLSQLEQHIDKVVFSYFKNKKNIMSNLGTILETKPYAYEYFPKYYQKALNEKENGAKKRYDKICSNIKLFILEHKELFGERTDYEIKDINIKNNTAKINFVDSPNSYFTGEINFNNGLELDTENLKRSLVSDMSVKENADKIESQNKEILIYKKAKDKELKNSINNYEKNYKKFNKDISFNSVESHDNVIARQKMILEIQYQMLKEIEKLN